MNQIINKTAVSSNPRPSVFPSYQFPFSMDSSPFMNWREGDEESFPEKGVVFLSLVATVKLQPTFDGSIEVMAVKFLESVIPKSRQSSAGFLSSLGRTTDESLTDFVQCIVVLISTPNQVITAAVTRILDSLIFCCPAADRLVLVKADLIPQLIITLNPQSLSFEEAVDIHTNLMKSISWSFYLATQDGLRQLGIEDHDEQQAVRETILHQVMTPSEKLLQISTSYLPAMDFVLHMPVVLTIPSSEMEQKRRRSSRDLEESASIVENGGHRRCD
ncbi:hypothetical protein BLNAU_9790 [Blattamonas nauphoetae]|uniref:Uncharacterized protein n=1 Tax=Blattamonas nauphoetae TaxID=2049346 RepID=A0ABQ9XUS7_9EUKA|nr:hypothetical protein BLNAU_9790 [Blattamonas nauphoetae]